jgi:putative nucleotidyltransferase with HDIG domain
MSEEWVLVVEPDESAARQIAELVQACGLHAVVASEAPAALHALATRPACRLALCNGILAGRSDLSLLHLIAAAHPHVPTVLLLDQPDVPLVMQAYRSGAADVLLAPATRTALEPVLERTLLERRSRENNALYLDKLHRMVTERTQQLRELMSDLERSYDVTIEAMGDALDLRDEETEGHSKRVTAYTIALARQMRLTGGQIKTIARGAFLHDIGKIAIPDSILLKPARLTAEEMAVMRAHCAHGYAIVRKIPFLTDAAEIVYSHQERYDGSGYPRGLRGSQIPLGARIFALVDALDAITSERPYRKASSFAHAREEIAAMRGRQFDPAIVDIFLKMPGTMWPAIRAEAGRHWCATDGLRAAAA